MANTEQTRYLTPQSQLRGRYTIIEKVGEGGMGYVYKAADSKANDRLVAIKEMHLDHYRSHGKQTSTQSLFRREARILSSLSHPNLPRVYAFFNHGRRSYLVIDFIEGKTLEQLLKESATSCLPVEDILRYAVQLCDVLSYLHQQTPPVIFRDLKPSNVMVTAKGHIFLIDFGIARVFKEGLSTDTQHLGTPGFASPEQHGDRQTGPRSDLYSLGTTLHYCLTGKDPRTNKPTLFDFLPPHTLNSQIPLALSELIQRLVATTEDQRPPDAETVKRELLSIHQSISHTNGKTSGTRTLIIEHVAQSSSWMRDQARQLGLLCIWLTNAIARQLSNVYSLLRTQFLSTILPRLKQLYRNTTHVSPARLIEFWQSFSTAEVRLLIQEIWTPYFTFLFVLFTIGMISSSIYMLETLHHSVHVVAFYFCIFLLLLLITAFTNQRIRHPLAHSILMATTLLLLLTGTALFAFPEVQSTIRIITFNQLLTVGIIVLVAISLLRPPQRFAWVDHLCLAVVAATYALLLNNMGVQALRLLLSISVDEAGFVNLTLVSALCIVALMELIRREYLFTQISLLPNNRLQLFIEHARSKHSFTLGNHPLGDRLQLFIVALTATILQLAYGLPEITHLTLLIFHIRQTAEQFFNLATFNVLVVGIPAVIALLRLFIGPGPSYLSRLLLLPLGLTCAALQNLLGPVVQFPQLKAPLHPLGMLFASIMHVNQLAAYSLVLIACILVCRWQCPFGWLDRFSLFCVVTVCAFLQSAAYNNNNASQSLQGIRIQQSQLYMIIINKLLAQVLMLIMLAIVAITISRIFLHLVSDFTWIDQLITRGYRHFMRLDRFAWPLNHFILLAATITNILLLWLHSSSSTVHITDTLSFTASQLIIVLLLIGSLAILIRISHPFGRTDRRLILMNVITSALLLFTGYAQQTITQNHVKITSVKPWLADPHIVLPSQAVAFALLSTALVSLMWMRRRVPQRHRSMLQIGFGLTLVCAGLQWLVPVFLLVGLIMLTLSVLLAMQIEQA